MAMAMSTQILVESSRLLQLLLTDTIQIYNAADPRTEGFMVYKDLVPVGDPIPSLVQHTTLENAVESLTSTAYAIKVSQGQPLEAGQVVEVITCQQEPDLVGKKLLLDKVSLNGHSVIRKAVASDWEVVNQEGKEAL